jgi:DNA-binding CsgD family transcriptional regulator
MKRVLQACYRGGEGDPAAVGHRVLPELRRVVAFDAAFMAVCDPDSLLPTAVFSDEPLAAAGPLFLDNEYGPVADVNRFVDLAWAADPVASLDRGTSGEWAASRRSKEIMSPLGMGDEARVVLRVDGSTWGYVCLHRFGATTFDARELSALRTIGPHIAEAIRHAVATATIGHDRFDDIGKHGLVVVAGDQISALGGAAEHWLEELGYGAPAVGHPLPLPLLALVRRLDLLELSGPPAPPASVRLRTRGGRLVTVHATRLRDANDSGPVALTVVPTRGDEHASLLLAAYALTPAQRRVAELVLQGRTTRQIVRTLAISQHTVQDHLKAVFDKVGVRSRRDLVAALMRPR